MKKSKLLAIVLAIVLIAAFALPMTASAANGSIKITSTNVNDQDFFAYKVFTVKTNAAETGGEATSFTYELNPEYAAFETDFAANTLKLTGAAKDAFTLIEYIKGFVNDNYELIAGNDAALDELARALWNYGDSNAAITPATAKGNNSAVTFPSLDQGYYVVVGSATFGTSNAKTFAALCTVVNDKETAVKLKADAPSIKKEIKNHQTNDWEKWTDVNIGDTVDFKLTSSVPNTAHYNYYAYTIHDNMSEGLTFDPASVVVKIAGAAINAGSDYTVVVPGKTGTFDIVFDVELLLAGKAYKTGDAIEVTYSATLNKDAVIEAAGNPNYVYLEYSNNPNWTGNGKTNPDDIPTDKTPEDDVWVYTYKLDIFKYTGKAGSEEALAGVKFQVLNSDGTKVAKFTVPATGKNAGKNVFDGWTAKLADTDAGYDAYLAATVLTTGADGITGIVGIDEGIYTLVEFEALSGYNKVADIETKIYNSLLTKAGIDGSMTKLVDFLNAETNRSGANNGASVIDYLEETNKTSVDVYNGKGSIFPGTGGIGDPIFIIAGLVVIGLGITMFVIFRRKSKLSALNIK